MRTKPVLFIFRSAPAAGARLRDGIETALAYAAFDQPVTLLFTEAAVLGLCQSHTSQRGYSDFLTQLNALELYEVDQPWVCAQSLTHSGLSSADLRISARLAEQDSIQQLLQQHTHVLVF